MPQLKVRPINEIAYDIYKAWPNVSPAARPYLDAMRKLDTIEDMYIADSAQSIVSYFLANASSFRGEDARRLKNELKQILG